MREALESKDKEKVTALREIEVHYTRIFPSSVNGQRLSHAARTDLDVA